MRATQAGPPVVRKQPVFRSSQRFQFAALSAMRLAAYVAFAWAWFSATDLWRRVPGALLAASFLVAVFLVVDLIRWCALPFMAKPVPMAAEPGWRVAVVTTCVPKLEPSGFLAPGLRALVALDYPHDTYLLDEGDDPRLRSLCADLGVLHFSRKNRPEYQTSEGRFAAGTKHGNYNAWLAEIGYANYDFLLAFDPDHIPGSEYASAVLGYFSDPAIGYVQAPQAYRNQHASWIARGSAEETYPYYSIVQMTAFGVSQPVVTGCHCTHRLSALADIGGFPDHAAEDLVATIRYQAAAWRGVYVPRILAYGLAPETWPAYLNQQFRWARSVFDIKANQLNRTKDTRSGLFSWLQGFGYLHDSILAGVGLPLFCVMLATGWGAPAFLQLHSPEALTLFAILWLTNRYKRFFYLDRAGEGGFHWRALLLRTAKWPRVMAAFWSALADPRVEYVVTPKIRQHGTNHLLLPMGLIVVAVVASWIIGIAAQLDMAPVMHIWAAIVVALAVALIGSELFES